MSIPLDLQTAQSPVTALQELLPILQLVSACSRSYLPAAPEQLNPASASALEPGYLRWWSPHQLVGRAIGSRRALRAAVSLESFELRLLEQSSPRISRIRARFRLHDSTLLEASAWLEGVLGDVLPRGYSRPLRLPASWSGPTLSRRFDFDPQALDRLSGWYDQAFLLLEDLAEYLDLRCTPVRFAAQHGELSFAVNLSHKILEVGFCANRETPAFFVRSWPVLRDPQQTVCGGSHELRHLLPDLQSQLPEQPVLKFLQESLIRLS